MAVNIIGVTSTGMSAETAQQLVGGFVALQSARVAVQKTAEHEDADGRGAEQSIGDGQAVGGHSQFLAVSKKGGYRQSRRASVQDDGFAIVNHRRSGRADPPFLLCKASHPDHEPRRKFGSALAGTRSSVGADEQALPGQSDEIAADGDL